MRNDKGFTLIELLVVILIIGIVAVIALPNFVALLARFNLESSAKEIAGDIRLTQQEALKNESTGYKVMFNILSNRYHIIFFINNKNHTYKTVKLPANVDLVYTNFNNNTLEFAASGTPVNRFGGHITLRDSKSGVFKYIIVNSVGRVRVSDAPP